MPEILPPPPNRQNIGRQVQYYVILVHILVSCEKYGWQPLPPTPPLNSSLLSQCTSDGGSMSKLLRCLRFQEKSRYTLSLAFEWFSNNDFMEHYAQQILPLISKLCRLITVLMIILRMNGKNNVNSEVSPH